ncbi:MAG: response regulator [Chthonomonadales bacterium]
MPDPATILLIEDERNFRRILEAKLTRSGFAVTEASNPPEALSALVRREYDAIILDDQLPGGRGLDLIPLMRRANPRAPVILMTAYEDRPLRMEALGAGASEVFAKPFELDHLVAVLRLRLLQLKSRQSLLLRSGQVLALTVDREGSQPTQATVIESGMNEFRATLQAARLPPIGTWIQASLPGDDGLYAFRCRVLAHVLGPQSLILSKPSVIYRRQRRRHPRMPVDFPVRVRAARVAGGRFAPQPPAIEPPADTPDAASSTPSHMVPHGAILAHARDLSLGGIALSAPQELAVGAPVALSWEMPYARSHSLVRVRGVVVGRTIPPNSNEADQVRLSVRFTRIPAHARTQITAFLENRLPV